MKRSMEVETNKRICIRENLKRTLLDDRDVKRTKVESEFSQGYTLGVNDTLKKIEGKLDSAVDNIVGFYESEIRKYHQFDYVPVWGV